MNEIRKSIIIRLLLDALKRPEGVYGYNIWLPNIIGEHTLLWNWAVEILKSEPPPYTQPTSGRMHIMTFGGETHESRMAEEIYPLAADILWLFCLRGILRPGVRQVKGQVVSGGEGYSLTLKGATWLENYSEEEVQDLLAAL